MKANVDSTELDNFNSHASSWWDVNGKFGALHKINPLRLEFIQKYQSISKLRILDIGCGGGILSEALASKESIVTGIDLAEDVLTTAKLHCLESQIKVDYQLISAEEFAKNNAEQFDMVTCMEMLEHVPEPQQIIQASADCVKSQGLVFFSTLNRNIKSYLFGIIAAEQVLKIVPKNTHTHEKFIKPSELTAMARKAGLQLIGNHGIEYNPISKEYKLSDNMDINYMLAFRKT